MDSSHCGHHNIDGGGGGGAAPVRPRRLRRLRTGRLMAAATVDSSAGASAATQGAWVVAVRGAVDSYAKHCSHEGLQYLAGYLVALGRHHRSGCRCLCWLSTIVRGARRGEYERV